LLSGPDALQMLPPGYGERGRANRATDCFGNAVTGAVMRERSGADPFPLVSLDVAKPSAPHAES
jgi:hypothetical protein